MKYVLQSCFLLCIIVSCHSSKNMGLTSNKETNRNTVSDTIKISNPEMGYDIVIIEQGFNIWLETQAKPKFYFNQKSLENKNQRLVREWNARVLNPSQYKSDLYEMQINYQSGIDYGYDLNYKLYNYFIFFQNKYKQNLLGTRVPLN